MGPLEVFKRDFFPTREGGSSAFLRFRVMGFAPPILLRESNSLLIRYAWRLISERTRAALAARKTKGARLGNRRNPREAAGLGSRALSDEADAFAANVLPVVGSLRAAGVTDLRGLANALNNRGVRTARGGSWHVSN